MAPDRLLLLDSRNLAEHSVLGSVVNVPVSKAVVGVASKMGLVVTRKTGLLVVVNCKISPLTARRFFLSVMANA